jgi:dihydrofolate reductase
MPVQPEIVLIAAIGHRRELGGNNRLLWNLPDDLRHFRAVTAGYPVIMGRKTFESIGRALPQRKNIVVSRDPGFQAEGVIRAASLEQAIALAKAARVFVIGGQQLFEQAIPLADRLILTHVKGEFAQADTFFPPVDARQFEATVMARHDADEQHAHAFEIREYRRIC